MSVDPVSVMSYRGYGLRVSYDQDLVAVDASEASVDGHRRANVHVARVPGAQAAFRHPIYISFIARIQIQQWHFDGMQTHGLVDATHGTKKFSCRMILSTG